jgi:protein-tyrosine-phosphatase
MVEQADLVLVMGHEHLARVREVDPTANVYLLAGYGSDEGKGHTISDPFGGDLEAYRDTADELERQLAEILGRIKAA